MSDLVQRLQADQPIVASLRPKATSEAFKAAWDRGLVHIKFTETRGGTELGIRLEEAACDVTAANFEAGEGRVRIVGNLVLDYVPVRFQGTIDLATFQGTGSLEPTGPSQWDV
jgi:hypothetical protein